MYARNGAPPGRAYDLTTASPAQTSSISNKLFSTPSAWTHLLTDLQSVGAWRAPAWTGEAGRQSDLPQSQSKRSCLPTAQSLVGLDRLKVVRLVHDVLALNFERQKDCLPGVTSTALMLGSAGCIGSRRAAVNVACINALTGHF